MRVLGIDPGSVVSGWAVISGERRRIKLESSGVFRFESKTPFLERLSQIQKSFIELEAKFSPDVVALESLIYVKSPQALIKLAQTRGIILSAFVEKYSGRIFEYSPNLVKSSATGYGHADKQSVQKFLSMSLGKKEFASYDETDAIAVAVCHLNNSCKTIESSLKHNSMLESRIKTAKSGSLADALKHKISKDC